jgi:hypothetical protein
MGPALRRDDALKSKETPTPYTLSPTPSSARPAGYTHVWSETFKLLGANKKFWLKIFLVHLFVMVLLTLALTSKININSIKDEFATSIGDQPTSARVTALTVNNVISRTSATSVDASFAATMLFIVSSLASLWAIRKYKKTGKYPSVKDAFYRSQTPLVPVVIVLLMMAIQCIPLILANWLLGVFLGSSIAVTWQDKLIGWVVWAALAYPSLRMLTRGMIATQIASLPGVGPLDAYAKASELVKHRRILIFRRLVEFFALLTFAIIASVVLSVVWLPFIVAYLPAVASALAIPLVATYMYSLYRSLW